MIGLWISRFTDAATGEVRQLTKWHYVESDIAGRQVTHCGRQMRPIDGTAIAPLVAPPTAESTCKQCAPREPATPGDEPMTE